MLGSSGEMALYIRSEKDKPTNALTILGHHNCHRIITGIIQWGCVWSVVRGRWVRSYKGLPKVDNVLRGGGVACRPQDGAVFSLCIHLSNNRCRRRWIYQWRGNSHETDWAWRGRWRSVHHIVAKQWHHSKHVMPTNLCPVVMEQKWVPLYLWRTHTGICLHPTEWNWRCWHC